MLPDIFAAIHAWQKVNNRVLSDLELTKVLKENDYHD